MKTLFTLFIFSIGVSSTALAQATNIQDSLALVEFYNGTNGSGWFIHTYWLSTYPVSQWNGIKVTGQRVTEINLVQNNLTGFIPASIGNISGLTKLDLDRNAITGNIPDEIAKLSELTYLDLGLNYFQSGTVPAGFGKLTKLSFLGLYVDNLYGNIPLSWSNLTQLTYIDMNSNYLSGPLPAWIGNLTKLTSMSFEGNQLSDTIPSTIGNLINLQNLFLNNNRLSGHVPLSIGNLVNLTYLALSGNKLSGRIPPTLGNLTKVSYMFLDRNRFSGHIPSALTNLTPYYTSLYINDNRLTFDGLELIIQQQGSVTYGGQAKIPIHVNGNTLAVSAGGTLSNNTYRWFKVGSSEIVDLPGDSVFHPATSGRYYAKVYNTIAVYLVLRTDTVDYTAPQTIVDPGTGACLQICANTAAKQLSVYPNPACNTVQVTNGGKSLIVIADQAGRVMLVQRVTDKATINISALSPGVYYIRGVETGQVQKLIVVR